MLEPGTAPVAMSLTSLTPVPAELAQGLKVVGHAKPRAIAGGSPRLAAIFAAGDAFGRRALVALLAQGGGVSGGGGDGGSSVREEKLKETRSSSFGVSSVTRCRSAPRPTTSRCAAGCSCRRSSATTLRCKRRCGGRHSNSSTRVR